MRIYAQAGQHLELRNIGSLASVVLSASCYVLGKNGKLRALTIDNVTAQSDRALSTPVVSPDRTEVDGEVVMAQVRVVSGTPKHGQLYCILAIRESGQELCRGYVSGTGGLNLGEYHLSTQGRGFMNREAIVEDEVGTTDTTITLAQTNTIRRVLGFSFYYEPSGDAASRVMNTRFRRLGGGLPTNFPTASVVNDQQWHAATIALTANQAGIMTVLPGAGKVGMISFNDNGTITYSDTNFPHPFPLWVLEGDNARMFMNTDAANANDRYSIYLYYEEWFDL